MVYRESSEMIRLLAGAGGVLAGLAIVFAAAALYYRRKRKNAVMKGCALQLLFLVIAASPVFVVPLLAYAAETGNGLPREQAVMQESAESEKISESELGAESDAAAESRTDTETESGTDTETESETDTETETESETDTETETESETETETETETQQAEPDVQEIARILESTEWSFLDDSGKTLRSTEDILLTGGYISRPDQVHLRVRIKDPAAEKVIAGRNDVLLQVFGGPETWRKEVQSRFRKAENWKRKDGAAIWETVFAEDGSYLIQIAVSRGEKEVPLICSEKTVIVDTTAPEIKADGLPASGVFSRKDYAVRMHVLDANPDEQAVPRIDTDRLRAEFSGWKKEEKGLWGGIFLKGEGSASLSFTARDRAGNKSLPFWSGRIVIDKTPPVLQIDTPEGNHSGSVIYVSSAPEIVISASDSHFDATESGVSVNAEGGGSWDAGSWQREDGQWKLHVRMDGDGTYSIFARGCDLAGNESEQALGQKIVMDSAAPEIHLSGATEGKSYRKPLRLEIQAKDSSLSAGEMHVRLLNQLNGRQVEKTFSPGEQIAAWQQEIAEDGIYILQVSAGDGAGNRREEEMRFRINTGGSTIEPDEDTSQILLSGFMKSASGLVFTEKNIDKLEERRLVLSASSPRILREGTDYNVEETIAENGMHSYRYEISADCFEKEGYYTLHLYSKDAAGNEYAGGRSEAVLHFAADYHSPGITVTGLEDGAVYRDKRPSFTVSVSDAVGMKRLRVSVNGKVVLEREAQEIMDAGGVFSLSLDPSQFLQEICVEALDAAGRSAQPGIFHVLVPEEAGQLPEKEEQFMKKAEAESASALQETEIYGAADVITDAMGGLEKKMKNRGERTFLLVSGFVIAGVVITFFLIASRRRKEDTSS